MLCAFPCQSNAYPVFFYRIFFELCQFYGSLPANPIHPELFLFLIKYVLNSMFSFTPIQYILNLERRRLCARFWWWNNQSNQSQYQDCSNTNFNNKTRINGYALIMTQTTNTKKVSPSNSKRNEH